MIILESYYQATLRIVARMNQYTIFRRRLTDSLTPRTMSNVPLVLFTSYYSSILTTN